jgi:small subunit ribosomal protein S9
MADDKTPTPEEAEQAAASDAANTKPEDAAEQQASEQPAGGDNGETSSAQPADGEQPEPQAHGGEPAAEEAGEVPGPEATVEGGKDRAGGGAQAGAEEREDQPVPRAKPAVPGAHLEVDIVPEGADPLGHGEEYEDLYASEEGEEAEHHPAEEEEEEQREELSEPISTAAIDLASGARYRATGKRKTAIARVTLRPGTGVYLVNGRSLEEHFPRATLQRNIRQPLETVGYQERMDVIARLGGGGISAQAGALRHGVSRALLEADPNLRGELKRRGFLTRDSRAKERKKAGLKKARKRPQFSKR